jgi:hypothetical protein
LATGGEEVASGTHASRLCYVHILFVRRAHQPAHSSKTSSARCALTGPWLGLGWAVCAWSMCGGRAAGHAGVSAADAACVEECPQPSQTTTQTSGVHSRRGHRSTTSRLAGMSHYYAAGCIAKSGGADILGSSSRPRDLGALLATTPQMKHHTHCNTTRCSKVDAPLLHTNKVFEYLYLGPLKAARALVRAAFTHAILHSGATSPR